jgi:predicted S18 family serine protease
VRPVGGIAQKAGACSSKGIELFLVPVGNEAEARSHAGAMKVIGVRNVSEAVRYLSGDDIP